MASETALVDIGSILHPKAVTATTLQHPRGVLRSWGGCWWHGVAHHILPHPGASKGGRCGTVPAQWDQDLKALLGPGCQMTAAHPSTALSEGAAPCQQHTGP